MQAPDTVTRTTMAEQVYAALKAQIVGGELTCGQRLLPHALAAALQVSLTPVKEALLRLERDGLVETEARRGVVVRRFHAEEIRDLYGLRTLLEVDAVRAGFARGGIASDLIDAMEAEQAALMAALRHRTLPGLNTALQHDRALHALIVGLAGNKLGVAWHAQAMTQTHTVRIYTPATYTPKLLRDEHGAIIAALRSGDEHAASDALRRHLDRSLRDLLTRVAAMGGMEDGLGAGP